MLPDGEVVRLGGRSLESPGPDLLGVFVGSEGTLGIATEITLRAAAPPGGGTHGARRLRLDRRTRAPRSPASSRAGILASAMEIMDRLTIEAAEAAVHPGYPDANALLLVELDGPAPQVEEDLAAVEAICRECGAWEIRTAASDHERALLWKGRKSAFAAMGRVSPRLLRPGRRRPADEAARGAAPDRRALESEYGLRVGNVFHAGDGNLHPLVLYDARIEGEPERARALAEAILEACIDAGGSLTGEHGIGVDKACSMPLLFDADDLEAMQRRAARVRSRPVSATPGRSSRRRACAARCPGPTASIRSRRRGLPSVSEIGSVHEAAEALAGAAERGERVSIEREGGDVVLSTRRLDRVLEHEAGDLTGDRRGRHPPPRPQRAARRPRADARARPAGQPDDRRVPRGEPLRPAPPPLRDGARPRASA